MNHPRLPGNPQTIPSRAPAGAAPAAQGPATGQQLRVKAAPLPLDLAAQLFSAFSPKDLAKEDVAGTLLRLSSVPGSGQDGAVAQGWAQALAGRGRAEEAESLMRQAVAHAVGQLGEVHARALELQVSLADLLQQQGKTAEARRLFVKTVELQRAHLGTQHPHTLRSLEKLAVLLVEQGDLRYAEPLLCEAVLVRRADQGDGHPDTLRALSHLSLLLLRQGKPTEAEPLLRQCLLAQQKLLGDNHVDVRTTLRYLAETMEILGNVGEAEMLYARGVQLSQRAVGAAHVETLTAQYLNAAFLQAHGRHVDARHILRNLLPTVRSISASRTQLLVDIEGHLGASMRAVGDFARAERHLTRSFEQAKNTFTMAHASTQYALRELIALYEAWGKPRQAAPFRAQSSACS